MSVIKSQRTESQFRVISLAIEIRKEITKYILYDFAHDGKLNFMNHLLLNDERFEILNDMREAVGNLEMANSIYVTTTAEYEERRLYQTKAIAYYNRLKQELNYIVDAFPGKINLNKYMSSIKLIDEEIGLIRAWRKSDNKLKRNLICNIGDCIPI